MDKQLIDLNDQAKAMVVFPAAHAPIEESVQALDLPSYKTVLLVLGGADSLPDQLWPRLTQLFNRGVARAAIEAGAVIVDGGTKAGVMELMGEGVASRGHASVLIGVAPAQLVAYPGSAAANAVPLEPNHSHFVLVEGEKWGQETPTLFRLATALINQQPAVVAKSKASATARSARRAVAVLVGGGPTAAAEVLRAVRQKLPLLIVTGTGGVADAIAAASQTRDTLPDDPAMAEILADGLLSFFALSSPVQELERLIVRELGSDSVLMQAWETFADYDFNANRQQQRFDWLQQSVIGLGLLATALAIIQQLYAPVYAGTKNLMSAPDLMDEKLGGKHPLWWVLHHVLIFVPILLTVLVTAANRFKQGSKWMLLRAGAEAIKREIYRYRTRAQDYAGDADLLLSQRIEQITRRTMRTEVNTTALVPYDKALGFPPNYSGSATDDGFGRLTPGRYVQERLGDQLLYFRKKAVRLSRQLTLFSWLTFIVGGLGTYLAAVNQQVWVALTTALAAALGTFLGYRQTESTLTKFNQAATDLSNVKAWWNALTTEEQLKPDNVNSLVEHTEQVLQTELDGWVQQMQNALAELRKNQTTQPENEENKEPKDTTPTTPAAADDGRAESSAAENAAENPTAEGAAPNELPVTDAAANLTDEAAPAGTDEVPLPDDPTAAEAAESAVPSELATEDAAEGVGEESRASPVPELRRPAVPVGP